MVNTVIVTVERHVGHNTEIVVINTARAAVKTVDGYVG